MFVKSIFVVVVIVVMLASFSCTTGEPKVYTINGITEAHTPHWFLGIPVGTSVEQHKTKAQRFDDIAIASARDQQRIEARRASIAVWMGGFLLAAAVACAFIGYLTKGWKRWGGLAGLCLAACAFCWGFVEWIEYLKWLAVLLPAVALGLFLYENKDFDLKEWMDKRHGTN